MDRIIVKEIPLAEYYEQPEGVTIDLDNAMMNEKSDRGMVVAVSDEVHDVNVGDVVFFDEYAMCDPVYLNPAHKHRTDLPKYWQMRVADVKGVESKPEKLTQWICPHCGSQFTHGVDFLNHFHNSHEKLVTGA